MGLSTVTVLTCDRCGASTTGPAPAGSARIELLYLNGEGKSLTWYCPSCTEAIVSLATTPPH